MPRKRAPSVAPRSATSSGRLFRKYWRDEKRRNDQLRKLAAKQFVAQVKHWVANDEQTRQLIYAEAAKLRNKLSAPGQDQRESLVIDAIINSWLLMNMYKQYLSLNCWTTQEFRHLQRRFVEAEEAQKASFAMLRKLRGLDGITSQGAG